MLSEFARTMVTEFPIQRILDRLVERIVEILPITGAGVTLITPGADPRYVAASDESALLYEKLQTELGEGPCLLAYNSGDAVSVADLCKETRFPAFASRALDAGLRAVFTFPLRSGADRLGALDLYRGEHGPLEEETMAAAQTLADVAAAYLLNAQARSELSEISARSHFSSLHDALTGLPNRVLLVELLEFALLRAIRSKRLPAVLFADLDQFKAVNDTYSHRVGDELLIAVAERLENLLRPSDVLGRLSGDEFVMVCEDLDHPSQVDAIAERISSALGAPFDLSCGPVDMAASVGIAFADHGESAEDLLHRADMAMYQAKAKGGGHHQIIDAHEQEASDRRTALKFDLHTAVKNRELHVHYQPIVNTTDRHIIGFEALLRWTHPTYGPISPSVLIPLAEEAGLIGAIGAWVLAQACADRRRWSDVDVAVGLGVSVNVSPYQLMEPGFVDSVKAILGDSTTGTEPALLTLEVTESVLIHDSARALLVLGDLKQLGVNLSLDDFGTGYSSLNYLDQFPADVLKIDQTFIGRLDQGRSSQAIVASIVSLSRTLGMQVVAEGVETVEQHEFLSEIDCDACQGFYFAKPMPSNEIGTLIDRPDDNGAVLLPVFAGSGPA
ncbi:MAG: EAL domain-containing protein [Acidobacteria bacterium]|nr:EAL domain-containing protein [Acidobacteriota bacterium]